MSSMRIASAHRGAHFRSPATVVDPRGIETPGACSGLRTILVPPDIVPVQRQSPPPIRKRTAWHPKPDGTPLSARPGGREWLGDRVFIESQDGHPRTGYSASIAIHALCILLATVVWMTGSIRVPQVVRATRSLVMPAMVAMAPLPGVASAPSPSRTTPAKTAVPPPPPPLAVTQQPAVDVSAAAPSVAPSSIAPESGIEPTSDAAANGVAGGIPGGVAGGTPGGTIEGEAGSGAQVAGPLRVGGALKAPRRIKYVNPIYPRDAIARGAGGIVIVDAIVGPDGKVQDATILRSIPLLDRAALDAVRQWEYEPTAVNGVPVSVVVTVIVTFAMR